MNRQVYRRRLYQQISEDIERLILDGTYLPESRLPSEQELADTYGVSRNVIRESLKSLKELGLVSIRTGSGTYVRRPTVKPVSEALHRFLRHSADGISVQQLYEVRQLIEPDFARLAALRATDNDLQTLLATLQAMDNNHHDPAVTSRADLDFHLGIAAATHNPLVSGLLDPIIGPLNSLINTSYTSHPALAELGLEDHRRIFNALKQRDPEQAHLEMHEHLSKGMQRLMNVGITNTDQLRR